MLLFLLLGSGPAAGHLLNMSRISIDVQSQASAAGRRVDHISALLELDLTRALGGSAAFHRASLAAQPLEDPILVALCDAIGQALALELDGQRISWKPTALSFSSQLLADYESRIVWPRATLRLEGRPLDAAGAGREPVRIRGAPAPFSLQLLPSFPFEEPIATTVRAMNPAATLEPVTMTRWLVINQRFPTLRPKLAAAIGNRVSAALAAQQSNAADEASTEGVLSAFLWLGITHVVPGGWDHLAFMFGLLLLATSLRNTIVLLSIYTLGHTLSYLALALRWIPAPGPWAETLILISLVWVGWSASRSAAEATARHAALAGVGGFGLVHGLGFAGSLGMLPSAPGELLNSIIGFNIGIEIAQLSVALLAGLLLALPVAGQPVKQRYRSLLGASLMILPLLVLLARWIS
ncbi:MAG: HupE/UreJ family protein [Pseudomonadota bacterium]